MPTRGVCLKNDLAVVRDGENTDEACSSVWHGGAVSASNQKRREPVR